MSATITADTRFAIEYLQQLENRLEDMQPVMSSIGQELENRISARFEMQSDPNGAAWSPWAESTKAQYPKDGNGRLLDRYGDMMRSLSHQATAKSVDVGFGQPYAAYHEWGTKRMPRRGLLFDDPDTGQLSQADEAAVLDVLQVWLEPK